MLHGACYRMARRAASACMVHLRLGKQARAVRMQVVGAWYRCRSQQARRLCLRCFWQEESAQRVQAADYLRMEPNSPGSAHSSPARLDMPPAAGAPANGASPAKHKAAEHGNGWPEGAEQVGQAACMCLQQDCGAWCRGLLPRK